MSAAAAEAILAALGRKVLPVKGDGNCLFRALGYYFYGTEMMHCKTRTLLSDFVVANSDRFKSIVMDGDVMNHVQTGECHSPRLYSHSCDRGSKL